MRSMNLAPHQQPFSTKISTTLPTTFAREPGVEVAGNQRIDSARTLLSIPTIFPPLLDSSITPSSPSVLASCIFYTKYVSNQSPSSTTHPPMAQSNPSDASASNLCAKLFRPPSASGPRAMEIVAKSVTAAGWRARARASGPSERVAWYVLGVRAVRATTGSLMER